MANWLVSFPLNWSFLARSGKGMDIPNLFFGLVVFTLPVYILFVRIRTAITYRYTTVVHDASGDTKLWEWVKGTAILGIEMVAIVLFVYMATIGCVWLEEGDTSSNQLSECENQYYSSVTFCNALLFLFATRLAGQSHAR